VSIEENLGDGLLRPALCAVVYDLGGRRRIADSTSATLLPPTSPTTAAPLGRDGLLQARRLPRRVLGVRVDGRCCGRLTGTRRPPRRDPPGAPRTSHAGGRTRRRGGARAIAEEVRAGSDGPALVRDASFARRLRDLLESDLTSGVTLAEAGRCSARIPPTCRGRSPRHTACRRTGTSAGFPSTGVSYTARYGDVNHHHPARGVASGASRPTSGTRSPSRGRPAQRGRRSDPLPLTGLTEQVTSTRVATCKRASARPVAAEMPKPQPS